MANLISVVRGLLYLCRKEFLAIVKDPANRVILIAPAIVQTLLFGYGATYDLNYVPYAVLDQSNGTASRELLARFDSTGVFQRVETLRRVEDIARVIDGGDALLVLHMGPDFEERLARERGSDLQLILDGRNSTTAGMAAGHIQPPGRRVQRALSAPGAATCAVGDARLVQPEPGDPLEYRARPDRGS
ncbi:hypothetical protein P4193_22890 [Pseudomonas aeruginosa]|nr:hypothetical protein [Pseudomonas aeruginosa]